MITFTTFQRMAVGVLILACLLPLHVLGQMNGNYTINPSAASSATNFQSFGDAVTSLVNNGVNGSVNITVSSGTYNEQVSIPNIAGASASNTITFDGVDRSNTTLTYAASVNDERHTLLFESAHFITFKNLSIIGTGGTYAWVVHIFDESSNITLKNCFIDATTSNNNQNFQCVIVNGNKTTPTTNSNQPHIKIDSCHLENGHTGVRFRSVGNPVGREVTNCLIQNYWLYGVEVNSGNGVVVSNNVFDAYESVTGNRNDNGLRMFNANSSGNETNIIENNKINTRYWGLYFATSSPGNTSPRGKIVNNEIIISGGTNGRGAYMTLPRNYDFYHNSFVMNTSTNSEQSSACYLWRPTDFDIRNNLFFYNSSTGSGYPFYMQDLPVTTVMDYNTFFTLRTGAPFQAFFDGPINSNQLIGYLGFNQNSYFLNPNIVSNTDVRPQSGCIVGEFIADYDVDLAGVTRPNPPLTGAYQPVNVPNNDAGITEIISPGIPLSSGDQDVVLLLRNFGGTTLTEVDVTCEVNNTSRTLNLTNLSIGACETDTVVFSGSNQFNFDNGFNTIVAYTSNPNDSTDADFGNDTTRLEISTPYSGTYTIHPTAFGPRIFSGFQDAAEKLAAGGIDGDVLINVFPATYEESVTFTNIPGVNDSTTITIDGQDTSNRILEINNATTMTIMGNDYMTIKNLTINQNSNSTAFQNVNVVMSNHTTFENVVFNKNTSASSANVILQYNSNENLKVINSSFYGGGTGVAMSGANTTTRTKNALVEKSYFKDQGYYAVDFRNMDSVKVYDNVANLSTSGSNFGTGFFFSWVNASDVQRNRISNAGRYGIFYSSENRNASRTSYCINNMVGGGYRYSSTSTSITINTVAIYLNFADNMKVYHNSALMDNNAASHSAAFGAINGPNNNDVRNNIFVHTNSNSVTHTSFLTSNLTSAFDELDYNVYYVDGTGPIAYDNPTEYTDLDAWRTAEPNFNEHSLEEDVDFESNTFLKLTTSNPRFIGSPDVGVMDDYFGRVRCAFPNIGADEGETSGLPPTAGFSGPDTVWLGTPVSRFLNTGNQNERHLWYVNNDFIQSSYNFEYEFQNTGTFAVKLVTEGCGGSDSVTKNIFVDTPMVAPTSEFIADVNITTVFGNVQFFDLSSDGANQWIWEVSPAADSNGVPFFTYAEGSATSQNPVIQFLEPGEYDICLTAINLRDTGNTECKTEYIEVLDESFMCLGGSSEEPSGFLHDDGGPGIPYSPFLSPVLNCPGFTIDVCAAEIRYELTAFDLRQGDFLRIYDGADNSGTPLWDVTANPNGITGNLNQLSNTIFTAFSGNMFFEFETAPGVNNNEGFSGFWTTTPGLIDPPSAAIKELDSSYCVNTNAVFEADGGIEGAAYTWKVDGVIRQEGGSVFQTNFNNQGLYDITMIISNCSGVDSATEQALVVAPSAAPDADFEASSVNPLVNGEVVTLSYSGTECPTGFNWTISPSNFTYVNGTNASSRNPQIIFTRSGCFDVSLLASNSLGNNSISKTCYISAIQYCVPTVATLTSDLGMTEVKVAQINHASASASQAYRNLVNTERTILERGATYEMSIARNTNVNNRDIKVWIDFNRDGDFDPVEELVLSTDNSDDLIYIDSISIPADAPLGFTRMRVATNAANEDNTPCGPNAFGEYIDFGVEISPDITAPVITLMESDSLLLPACQGFGTANLDAIAFDNVEGDVSDNIVRTHNIDFDVEGFYRIEYRVSDSSGNTAIKFRNVRVLPDLEGPEITILGDNPFELEVFGNFVDPGVDAVDDCSGLADLSSSNNIDPNNLGSYEVTYVAIDSNGNERQAVRTVNVVDLTPPNLVQADINEGETVTLEVFDEFMMPNIEFEDNYDSELIRTVSGSFYDNFPSGFANVLGTYNVEVTFADQSGNEAQFDFFVEVVDNTPPVVSLDGMLSVEICRFDTINRDTLVTLRDNYDDEAELVLETSGSYVSDYLVNFEAGTYELIYNARDLSGNVSEPVIRSIMVDACDNLNRTLPDFVNSFNVYPNPAKDFVNIEYQLASAQLIHLEIRNSLGQVVEVLESGFSSGENHQLDLSHLASGVYHIRLNANDEQMVKRLVITK